MDPVTLIAGLGGLVFPPVMDFIKKKFLPKDKDTPEATMSSLAMTKPEVLPEYINGLASYMQAQVSFFNRDVVGTPSTWVIDLRSVIRPAVTIISIMALVGQMFMPNEVRLSQGTEATLLTIVSSWFGDRIVLSKD